MKAQDTIQLPEYQCHKKVRALKIKDIIDPNSATDGSRLLIWESPMYSPIYGPIAVDGGFMDKHNPQIGGYYVVYDDGYISYLPAKDFEEGYTLL